MSKKQYGGWASPPPVVVLAGSEGFFRRREVAKATSAALATDREVHRLDGSVPGVVADTLDGAMFGGKVLAIVTSPEDVDLDLLRKHIAGEDSTVSFLLHHDGSIKKTSSLGKFAGELPKQHYIVYDKPEKSYKHEDYAVKFAVNEAHRLNISISTDLAEALVGKVGTDLGILHYELLKVATYMAALGEGPSVTPAHIKATLATIGEANVNPLSEALGIGSIKGILRETDRLSREHSAPNASTRTLAVCAWLGNQAVKWLHAAALNVDGASEEEAAARIGTHPYVYRKFLLPVAKRWGPDNLRILIRRIAKIEVAAKTGHIDPWVELESGLVGVVHGARNSG